jgi:hypothetical protein
VDNHGLVPRVSKLGFCFLVFTLQAAPALSAPLPNIPFPEPEAPTTIFSTKLGDAEVDLNMSGSWDASVSLGSGLLLVPGLSPRLLDSFPSLETGFIFSQVPHLTASVVLLNKYFFDLSVVPNFTRNSLTLGYRGDPQEVIRSVFIGNGEIAIPPSGFLEIPGQATSSLGASALLVYGLSENQLLLRWDSTDEKTKTFLGSNELVEETIPPYSFIRGRFFFFPDQGVDPQSLVIYIEDPQGGTVTGGDGKRYRVAALNDAFTDASAGILSLTAQRKGRVLVYYTKDAVPIGTVSPSMGQNALPGETSGNLRDLGTSTTFNFTLSTYLGQDMTHRRITIPGTGTCLLLWEPGDASPFEMDASYPFTETPPADPSRILIRLQSKEPAGVPEAALGISFRSLPDEKRFVAFANPIFRADFKNMYPFPDPDGLIYGPPRDSLAGYLGYDIHVQLLTPTDSYVLEPNIVADSVRVMVNGISETRFQADAGSGKVTFLRDINPTDRIDIGYRVTSTGLSGGDLLFAWRDTLEFSDALKLSLSAGVRWNANPLSYSQKAYARSGTVLAQAELQGAGDNWSYSIQAGLAYTDPDTSGVLRLFGMEGNSLGVDLAEDNAFPAAPPLPGENGAPAALTQVNRGKLYYRDFRTYDALGGATLNPITWPEAPARTYPSETGGRMGPYNVSGSSAGPAQGQSLVFDFEVFPGEWVGAQLLPEAGGDMDLSTAQSITIRYQTPVIKGGSYQVFLQAGSLTEDINEDGVLQAEKAVTDAGFPFFDQAHGATLKAGGGPKGQGNGRLDSEDRDGNGILDVEEPARIVTISMGAPFNAASSEWRNFTYSFTSRERSMLANARQIRLLIVQSGGSEASGELLIDAVSIEGAAEHGAETPASSPTPGSVSIREIAESLSASDPGAGKRLQDIFPGVTSRLHPNGELQQVLEVLWGSPNPLTNPLVITAYAGQGTGGIQYDTVLFYLRPVNAAPSTVMGFSLVDPTGLGISWSLDVSSIPAGGWHEMKVSKTLGKIFMDGKEVGGLPPTFDAGYGSLSKLSITLNGSEGALSIDEIQMQDPEGAVGGAVDADLSYQVSGPILQVGGVQLLGDFSAHQRVSFVSSGFSSLYGIPYPSEDIFSQTELDAEAFFTKVTLDVLFREYAGNFTASGSHRITIPSFSFPVTLTDAFSLNYVGEFSRENIVSVTPGGGLALTLDVKSDGTQSILNQSWDGKLTISPFTPLSLSSELLLYQGLSGYPLPMDWYGASWVRGMDLILPWAGGSDVARREKLDFSLQIPLAPIGIQLSADALALSSGFSSFSRNQQNDLDLSLTLLMHLGADEANNLTVSLGYTRYISLVTNPQAGERFVSEAQSYGRLMSAQVPLFTVLPFFELFQDNSAVILPLWVEASSGIYSPRATVSLQRSYGSRLIDLLLPTSIDLTLGQDFKKAGGLSSTQMFILPKVSSHALNLFGRLGAYPFFPFARTDEYGVTFSASLSASRPQLFSWTEAILDVFASLTGLSDERITLTHSFKWEGANVPTLSDATRFTYVWTYHPAGGVPIPLLPSGFGGAGYFSHTESGGLTLMYSGSGSYHPLNCVFGHETALILPKNGSFKAHIEVGFDLENLVTGAFASRIGFQIGLEAKLSF